MDEERDTMYRKDVVETDDAEFPSEDFEDLPPQTGGGLQKNGKFPGYKKIGDPGNAVVKPTVTTMEPISFFLADSRYSKRATSPQLSNFGFHSDIKYPPDRKKTNTSTATFLESGNLDRKFRPRVSMFCQETTPHASYLFALKEPETAGVFSAPTSIWRNKTPSTSRRNTVPFKADSSSEPCLGNDLADSKYSTYTIAYPPSIQNGFYKGIKETTPHSIQPFSNLGEAAGFFSAATSPRIRYYFKGRELANLQEPNVKGRTFP